jgi:predicted RNA-binding protein with RPS1 domain
MAKPDMSRPHYIERKDFEDIYKVEDRHERPLFEEEKPKEERKERLVKQIQRRALPRMDEKKVVPLDRKPSEVIGTLFDKVKFLRERVAELEGMINDRVEIHNSMIKDIDDDIRITNEMAGHAMDMDERRNLKLDVSIMRKEKRNEQVQFWRDIVELRAELREMVEKFQMESEISNLFKDLKKDEADEEAGKSPLSGSDKEEEEL